MKTESWSKLKRTDYIFKQGEASDHSEVMELSKKFDLDILAFNIEEFCVVRKDQKVVGFGRLRPYNGFMEVATVGVIDAERSKGIGSEVVNCLVKGRTEPIFLTCVIPGFFSRLGFIAVSDYPLELNVKYNFCRSFGYKENEVHVMKRVS